MMHNGMSAIPWVNTGNINSNRLSIVLRNLGFAAIPLHGQLSQSQRLGSLSKFQSGSKKILVATDVASRWVPAYAGMGVTDGGGTFPVVSTFRQLMSSLTLISPHILKITSTGLVAQPALGVRGNP
jgi:hypothetical protein